MIVFCKTCARDADRVQYLIGALEARGLDYVIATESFDAPTIRRFCPVANLVKVEQAWPEAMKISNHYLRQQYIKTVAAQKFGDMLIVDSDMCPKPGAQVPLWRRWYYAAPPPRYLDAAVFKWVEAYKRYVGSNGAIADYMRQSLGWFVSEKLSRAFVEHVVRYNNTPLWNVLLRARAAKFKWSEFQFLGTFAHDQSVLLGYRFINGPQPDWCYHFSSAWPLREEQREMLKVARYG